MLRLKVSVEPNEQHHNTDPDEGRAERFAEMSQSGLRRELQVEHGLGLRVGVGMVFLRRVGEVGVQAEELGYCDADAGEGEGGAEPGEEGAFLVMISMAS
jgi:hypothetical protein